MSSNDPVADLCTQIRNGQTAGLAEIRLFSSKLKLSILSVLKAEGYIEDYIFESTSVVPKVLIRLKYHEGNPVIARITRISKPGRRVHRDKASLPMVLGGLGVAIVSTSQGVMTGKAAAGLGFGGEVLCAVE